MNINNAFSIILPDPCKISIPMDSLVRNAMRNIHIGLCEGVDEFVIGLYSETQIFIAERILLTRKEKSYLDIKFYVVRDYSDQYVPWKGKMLKSYRKIIKLSDGVFTICSRPGKNTRKIINDWLIQHTSGVVPVFTGDRKFIKEMIDRALEMNKGYTCVYSFE